MSTTVVLFDIDHTLFATNKLRDITYPQLMHFLNQEDRPRYHEQVKTIEKELIKEGSYEPVLFARTLAKALQIQPEYEAISNLFYDKSLYDSCLYPDVKIVLKKLADMKGLTLGIVSKGENTFQRRKIESIAHFFKNEDIYISLNKSEKIDEIYNQYADKKIIIIDDSALFLNAVKTSFPSIVTVLIEREVPYEKREVPADFLPDMTISQLDEIFSLF